MKLKRRATIKLAFLLLALISLVILLIPLIPQLAYYINPPKITDNYSEIVSYSTEPESRDDLTVDKTYNTYGNRLVIPQIGVDTKILEGSSEDILLSQEGVWRDPETSNPGLGNMVIAGHRFQYLPPNTTTFYHLDKLSKEDEILVYWEGKKHTYKVYDIFEINPTDVWIKNKSENLSEITLYTCTPLYTSEKRLVIKAREVL